MSLCLARGQQEAPLQQIERGPAEHLALDELQAVHVALDRAVAPRQRYPRFDRLVIVAQPVGKALDSPQ